MISGCFAISVHARFISWPCIVHNGYKTTYIILVLSSVIWRMTHQQTTLFWLLLNFLYNDCHSVVTAIIRKGFLLTMSSSLHDVIRVTVHQVGGFLWRFVIRRQLSFWTRPCAVWKDRSCRDLKDHSYKIHDVSTDPISPSNSLYCYLSGPWRQCYLDRRLRSNRSRLYTVRSNCCNLSTYSMSEYVIVWLTKKDNTRHEVSG